MLKSLSSNIANQKKAHIIILGQASRVRKHKQFHHSAVNPYIVPLQDSSLQDKFVSRYTHVSQDMQDGISSAVIFCLNRLRAVVN